MGDKLFLAEIILLFNYLHAVEIVEDDIAVTLAPEDKHLIVDQGT